MKMKLWFAVGLVVGLCSLPVFAKDLGFRYTAGKCQNAKGEEGLNPSAFGQCSDLRGVVIYGLHLDDMDFSGSLFNGADLQLTTFNNTILVGVNFSNTLLMGSEFVGARIEHANFTSANIQNAKFVNASFNDVNFTAVNFTGQLMSFFTFNEAQFDGANFTSAQLEEAIFTNSTFLGANFTSANLKGATLVGAGLGGATFHSADMRKVNLSSADLQNTNLKKSNLEGAKVDKTNFENAKYSRFTTLPFTTDEASRRKMIFIRLYEFSGIKKNLAMDELDGWTVCNQTLFSKMGNPLSKIYEDCRAQYVMLACRPTGSNILTVAAYGTYDKIFNDIGESNAGTVENGVKFYFSDNYSIGFAQADKSLERDSCDIGDEAAESRLCFHTSNKALQGGYRCGATTSLNGSDDYERLFFKSED